MQHSSSPDCCAVHEIAARAAGHFFVSAIRKALTFLMAFASRLRILYETAYERHPHTVAGLTAVVLGGGGDLFAQKVQHRGRGLVVQAELRYELI